MKKVFGVVLCLTFLACGGEVQENVADVPQAVVSATRMDHCTGMPAAVQGKDAYRFIDYQGELLLAPAHPKPGEEVFVAFLARKDQTVSATARFTANAWATSADAELARWCDVGSDREVYGASLGSFAEGARVELALRYLAQYASERWLNNGGANYSVVVKTPAPLSWLGDTYLGLEGSYLPADLVPAGRAVQVFAQTYPMGAAAKVELFWADASFSSIQSATMRLDMDFAGGYGANSQWITELPAEALRVGETVHYWLKATDHGGAELWDSRNGQNYQVQPRRFDVVWAGGLGSYRPTSGDYVVGSLFMDAGSTAPGGWNHGASMSSYRVRAVRVYVPGLTDRSFGTDAEVKTAAALLTVQAWTNASGSWGAMPAQFQKKVGNDFLFGFFSFNDFCSGGGGSNGFADGNYEYKVRFSTDGGASWTWLGRADGSSFHLQFGVRCRYFTEPFDCIPTETTLTRSFEGGFGTANLVKLETSAGVAVTDARVLTNGTGYQAQLSNIRVAGSDAALFSLSAFDAEGEPLSLAGTLALEPGQQVRFEITYLSPTVSGVLPHAAALVWDESTYGPPGPTGGIALHLRGVSR